MSGAAAARLREVGDALRFYTRLPAPGASDHDFDFARFAWAAPLAGAVVGLVGAAALGAAWALGLPAAAAAVLAIAASVAATGAFHEDGLADVFDGFGGGATRERKLAIMRDSRIGSFGAAALVLALGFRAAALSAALAHGLPSAAAALVATGAVSRAGGLMPLAWLDPARADGAGAAVGRLPAPVFAAACAVALAFALPLGTAAAGLGRALAAILGAAIGAAAMTALARRQIGGQTGDVAGAAQQWAEIAAWCGLLIGRGGA